jgi:hypothetical protein
MICKPVKVFPDLSGLTAQPRDHIIFGLQI